MPEYRGIDYLRKKLREKRTRVDVRYRYYEMKKTQRYISGIIPPELRWLTACLGWNATAVDALADRIVFNEFKDDNFDMMQISHMNNTDILYDNAGKAQRTFGSGFLNAEYLAACVRDKFPYRRNQIYLTKPIFEPIFEPDAAMLSGIGDGAIKINQAVPGYFNKDNLRALTGIEASRNTNVMELE